MQTVMMHGEGLMFVEVLQWYYMIVMAPRMDDTSIACSTALSI